MKSDFEIEGHTLKAYIGESEIVDNIPSHITAIGDEAFYGNKKIKKVIIPDSVMRIGAFAFCQCSNLKEIVIPDSVKVIGSFNGSGLEHITLPSNLGVIGEYMFYYCPNLKSIIIPNGVEEIGLAAFGKCTSLEEITIPGSVTKINDAVFLDCCNIKKVLFENWYNIEEMGEDIFRRCPTIPEIVPSNIMMKYHDNFYPPTAETSKPDESKKGCYIATCIYGSYDCPEVWTLRRFRDNILDKNLFGRLFIKTYYLISPKLVKYLGDYSLFKIVWRKSLDSLLQLLRKSGIEDTPYKDL